MNDIVGLIRAATEEGSENVLTLVNAKNWLAGYVQMHEQESARFPIERNRSHWDILVADYDPNRNAMFLFAFFRGESVTLIAGRGSVHDVREFAENSFPKEPDGVLDELSSRFWVTPCVIISQVDLVHWLKS